MVDSPYDGMAPGQAILAQMRDQGYGQDVQQQFLQYRTQQLRDSQYGEDVIQQYWGMAKPADDGVLRAGVKQNLQGYDYSKLDPSDPKSWGEMWATGWQHNSIGLATGSVPTHAWNDKASGMAQFMQLAGYEAGEFPLQAVGYISGAAAGAAGGAETGPGAAATGYIAGGYGMGVLPALVRNYYMDGLKNGQYKDWPDFTARMGSILMQANLEGTESMYSMIGGKGVIEGSKLLAPAIAKVAPGAADMIGASTQKVMQRTGEMAAWAASGVAVQSAFEMRTPSAQDFEQAGIMGVAMGLLFHGGIKVIGEGPKMRAWLDDQGKKLVGRMQEIYTDTGITPKEQVMMGANIPAYRQALAAHTADGEAASSAFKPAAPSELMNFIKDETGAEPLPVGQAPKEGETPEPIKADETARVSSTTGLRDARNVSPQQLLPIIKDAAMYDEQSGARGKLNNPDDMQKAQLKRLQELLPKYKNPNGSVDIESALAAYHAGEAKAAVFKAAGHDYSKLPPATQRFLEEVGGHMEANNSFELIPPEQPKVDAPPKVPGAPKTKEELVAAMNKGNFPPDRPPPTLPEKVVNLYRRARYGWSRNYPAQVLDKLDKSVKSENEYGVGTDGALRLISGAAGPANARYSDGGLRRVVDKKSGKIYYDFDKSVPGLKSIYEEAQKRPGGLHEYNAVQQAANTRDLANLRKETKVSVNDAQATLEQLEPKWRDLLDKERLVMNSLLDRLVASGRLSKNGAAMFKLERPDWHPTTLDQQSRKIGVLGDVETEAARNEAKLSAVKSLRKLGWIDNESAKAEEDYRGALDDLGERYSPMSNGKKIVFYEGGIKKTAYLKDVPMRNMLVDSLMNLSYDRPATASKVFSAMAHWERSTITTNPAFLGRIAIKDGWQAYIAHPDGGIPVLNTFKGAFSIMDNILHGHITEDGMSFKKVAQYQANGGYNMAVGTLDNSSAIREIRRTGATGWERTVANVTSPMGALRDAMKMVDAASRIGGVYSNAAPRIGPKAAVVESRIAHGDYGEPPTSQHLRVLIQAMPFTMGWMRGGVDATVRAITTQPKTVLASGITTAMLSAALYGHNLQFQDAHPDMPEDAKVQNFPAWARYAFMWFTFQSPFSTGPDSYHSVPIPVPWALGELFHGPVQAFMDHWIAGDPHAAAHWAGALADQMFPADPFTEGPFTKPLYEGLSGKDARTGNPIVPAGEAGRSGYLQYGVGTSEIAKSLTKWLGPEGQDYVDWSARKVDKIVKDIIGPTGTKILQTLEVPEKASATTSTDEDWYRTTFGGEGDIWIGGILRQSGVQGQPIEDFYDLYGQTMRAEQDLSFARKAGLMPTLQFWAQNPAARIRMNNTAQSLSRFRSMAVGIENNKAMTVEDKQGLLRNISNFMILTAKNAVDQAHYAGLK